VLEGVVTNVAAFGAFVDIGVHQDGLVHISALSNTYVKDPRDVVKSGDVVKVKVLEVDEARKRIGLTLRLTDEPGKPAPKQQGGGGGGRDRGGRPQQRGGGQQRGGQQRTAPTPASGSMADALRKAGFGK
jgi:protein Tex